MIETKAYWEERAAQFGSRAPSNLALSEQRLKEELDVLYSLLRVHLKQYKSLLDAGSGAGRFQPLLKTFCKKYVGVDFSKNMLLQTEGVRVQSNLTLLPFSDRAFDQVVCTVVLQHIVDDDMFLKALQELIRVCRVRLLLYDAFAIAEWKGADMEHVVYRSLYSYVKYLVNRFNVNVYPGPFPHLLIVAQRKWWR